MKLTAREMVSQSIIELMREEPFFASIALRMEVTESTAVPTVCTNGDRLTFNPEWVEKLPPGMLTIVIKHECMHVALGHHIRLAKRIRMPDVAGHIMIRTGEDRFKMLDNLACDLAINSHLIEDARFPKNDASVWYAGNPARPEVADMPTGLNAEAYYDLIEQELNKREQEEKQKGGCGDGTNSGTPSGSDVADNVSNDSVDQGGSENPEQANEPAGSEQGDGDTGDASSAGENDRRMDKSSGGQGDGETQPGEGVAKQPVSQKGPADSGADTAGDSGAGDASGDTGNRLHDEVDHGTFGTVEPAKGDSAEDIEAAEARWQQTVASAMTMAKQAGNMPGWIEEKLEGMFRPAQVPWQRALRPFLTETVRGGYSYARPSRRNTGSNVILPSPYIPSLGDIVFLVDSSGSMSQDEMNLVFPELQKITITYKEAKIAVKVFDTKIRDEHEFTFRDFPMGPKMKAWTWKGRGGTYYRPVFDAVKKMRPKPILIVCLTDGYPQDDWPETTPCPVVWLITERGPDFKAPIGRTIRMED